MIEWVMGVVDRIEEEARRDPEYRELILEYMETPMNRQYRFSQIAWRYGRRHPQTKHP